jgi:hypothetical protein
MPWSTRQSSEESFVRRLAYYIHWRSNDIGKNKASEVMDVNRKTLRRYANYNYDATDISSIPSHNWVTVIRLADYCGDNLATIVLAIQNTPDFYAFRQIVTNARVVAEMDNEAVSGLVEALTKANNQPKPLGLRIA